MFFDPNQSRDMHLDYVFLGLNRRPVYVRWVLTLNGNGSDYFCTARAVAGFASQYGNRFGSQHPVSERERYISRILRCVRCRHVHDRTGAGSAHPSRCVSAYVSPRSQTADRKRLYRKVRRSAARVLPDQRSKRAEHIATAFVKRPILRACVC